MRHLLGPLLVCAAVLAACERDSPVDEGALESAVVVQDSEIADLRATGFLRLIDGDVAALWLALKAQAPNEQAKPAAAVVAQYEESIRELATRLLEDRRMIANRTVQTRDELADHGVVVAIDDLVSGLLEVARAGVVGNYGSYCDYYINLRQRPLAHAAAVAEMRSLRMIAPGGAP